MNVWFLKVLYIFVIELFVPRRTSLSFDHTELHALIPKNKDILFLKGQFTSKSCRKRTEAE